jgi:hypothetical protein
MDAAALESVSDEAILAILTARAAARTEAGAASTAAQAAVRPLSGAAPSGSEDSAAPVCAGVVVDALALESPLVARAGEAASASASSTAAATASLPQPQPAGAHEAAAGGAGLGVAAALAVYCASGTLLTLANKLAVGAFPAPHTLLLFQNGLTVLLLLALTTVAPARMGGALPPLSFAAVRTWLPLSLLFVGMLATSLLALQCVSAVTLIVVRNLGTLVVAFFEYALLGSRVSTLSTAAMVGIFLGVACYGANDVQFSAVGYAWLAANIACTAAYQIYVKALLTGLPKTGEGALGPFGMSYYNNLISLPVLVAVAAVAGEAPRFVDLARALSPAGAAAVLASGVLGLVLSTSAFLVNTLVTATTMMVANNVNKFALVAVSELAMQATLGPAAAVGTALAVASAWLYAESRGRWASSGALHAACEALGTPRLLALPLLVAAGYVATVTLLPASSDSRAASHIIFVDPLVPPAQWPDNATTAAAATVAATITATVAATATATVAATAAATVAATAAATAFAAAAAGVPWLSNLTAAYAAFVPQRTGPPWVPRSGVLSAHSSYYYLSSDDFKACPRAASDPYGFKTLCNVGPCQGGQSVRELMAAAAATGFMPATTATGERVADAVQRALRAAWGPAPPHVDLYFRAGCGAVGEMATLFATIELFWPAFLGEVLIALDAGNGAQLNLFRPPDDTRHSYRFVYEDVPCIPGSVMNQVSYMNLDAHTNAPYIVTVDSDCGFFTPVTPDVLFDERGKLLLPYSDVFQGSATLGAWKPAVEWFTGPGSYTLGHTMMTQPVAFARPTFAAFRAWMGRPVAEGGRGECYYDAVSRFVENFALPAPSPLPPPGSISSMLSFCWMCQLFTFMTVTNATAELYNFVTTDTPEGGAYMRYSYHSDLLEELGDVDASIRTLAREGLCRALGDEVVPACAGVSHSYADLISFQYAHVPWMLFRSENAPRLAGHLERFQLAERVSRSSRRQQ